MRHHWLDSKIPIRAKAPKTIVEAPVASPSRPSVRFTALEKPVMSRVIQKIASTTGRRSQSTSCTKEM